MMEPGNILQQRYRIDKQIGQGGMGAVYLATDERFNSIVAIKQTLAMGDQYRKAIEREARLLNSLRHPALPRVSDHFLEDDGQFLVMEYIPGKDLSQTVEAMGGPFPIERVLRWADQLLDALDFLHNQSIPVIHRDIKPQNLKLTSRDQIILLDFGLAKGNPTDVECQTAAKSIFGYSRNYASLEQIEGTGTDPRSDLYSLAATLYHLATGVPPEDALTRAISVLCDRPDPLEPANVLQPEIPSGLASVLHKALNLNADERPNSAAEMRQMLRECENNGSFAGAGVPIKRRENTDSSAEKTRLMSSNSRSRSSYPGVGPAVPETTGAEEISVTPAAGSQVAYAPPKTISGVKIASALVVVLVIVGSAMGLYYYEPSLVRADSAAPTVTERQTALDPDRQTLPVADAGSSERVEPIQRGSQKTQNASAEIRPVEKPRVIRTSANSNVAIGRDKPGSVYVGHNVWVGGRKLPDNVYIDENGIRHRTSSKY